MIKETELQLDQLDQELAALREKSKVPQLRIWQLEGERRKLLEAYPELTPADKVYLARRPKRPGAITPRRCFRISLNCGATA